MTKGSGARGDQEAGTGLGLGEQRKAGSRDGGGIYRAVHDVEAGWGWQGAAGHDVPRKDGGAGRAELSRDMVAEGGAHHRQGSTLAKVHLQAKVRLPLPFARF